MHREPLITIQEAARKQALTSIKRYFLENLDEEIGDLKADLLLDYFLKEIAPTVYNQAIADARTFIEQHAADLDAVCYREEFSYWPR